MDFEILQSRKSASQKKISKKAYLINYMTISPKKPGYGIWKYNLFRKLFL